MTGGGWLGGQVKGEGWQGEGEGWIGLWRSAPEGREGRVDLPQPLEGHGRPWKG